MNCVHYMLHDLTTYHIIGMDLLDSEGSPAESIPDPERKIFVRGGRLKRTNAQSNSNENTVQVHRMKGRIVRTSETEESATAGGSIAVRDL